MNPSICHRMAFYTARDGFGRERTATIPLPDDMTPSKTIQRMGLTMTLRSVHKVDENETDWFTTAGIICNPKHL